VEGDGPESTADLFRLPKQVRFNPVVVVGTDGRVVYHAMWLDAGDLDEFLRSHLATQTSR
jgi:hypothetical protein